MLPEVGSPVIDAAPADCSAEVATDQRGITRPQFNRCDTGAVELDGNIVTNGFESGTSQ